MAESELSISYDDLLLEVAAFLGYGSVPASWTSEQIAEVDRYVQSGVRKFYYPPASSSSEAGYSWSFLHPTATLATVADDAAQDLPYSLARVMGDFYYDSSNHQHSIVLVDEGHYKQLISRTETTGRPRVARVRVKDQVANEGQQLEVAWWPIPDGAYTLSYQYEAYNGKLSAQNKYPLGGMRHAELLTEACLAVAEQKANDERGLHTDEFERQLKAAIEQDRRLGARFHGPMGDPSEHTHAIPRHGDTGGNYPVTYKGLTL